MAYRHQRSKVLSVLAATTLVAATFVSGGVQFGGQAGRLGMPGVCPGFSEIVTTPAVVNIASRRSGEGVEAAANSARRSTRWPSSGPRR
ncbi:MAG: hypothetical protein MRJ92_07955 [Nitrospira sp.]|nr:hypothetical protein [Nitrospira sp.]